MNLKETLRGYWGNPTSTIDWCEKNYEQTFYIAEFWNTISNLGFLILGIYGLYKAIENGLEKRFQLQFIALITVGIGSALFHGTLQLV